MSWPVAKWLLQRNNTEVTIYESEEKWLCSVIKSTFYPNQHDIWYMIWYMMKNESKATLMHVWGVVGGFPPLFASIMLHYFLSIIVYTNDSNCWACLAFCISVSKQRSQSFKIIRKGFQRSLSYLMPVTFPCFLLI